MLPVQLRPSRPDDLDFVTRLSGDVFNVFGAYDEFLPRYLNHPQVITTVALLGVDRVGFTMLALVMSEEPLPWRGPPSPADEGDDLEAPPRMWVDAEMVAIAVAPSWQAQGIGRHLLGSVIAFTQDRASEHHLRSLQLNVASDNARALALFRSEGFRVVNEEDGRYPRGQRSIRMALEL